MQVNAEVLARLNCMDDLVALARQPETTAAALDAIAALIPATRRHAFAGAGLPEWLAREAATLS